MLSTPSAFGIQEGSQDVHEWPRPLMNVLQDTWEVGQRTSRPDRSRMERTSPAGQAPLHCECHVAGLGGGRYDPREPDPARSPATGPGAAAPSPACRPGDRSRRRCAAVPGAFRPIAGQIPVALTRRRGPLARQAAAGRRSAMRMCAVSRAFKADAWRAKTNPIRARLPPKGAVSHNWRYRGSRHRSRIIPSRESLPG